ncbi:hypothetical protein YC2023_012585 [Brassica napus]
MARSPPPPFTTTTQRKYRMQHNRFHRRSSLSSDASTNKTGRDPATRSCDSLHPPGTRADDGGTKEASPPRMQGPAATDL